MTVCAVDKIGMDNPAVGKSCTVREGKTIHTHGRIAAPGEK